MEKRWGIFIMVGTCKMPIHIGRMHPICENIPKIVVSSKNRILTLSTRRNNDEIFAHLLIPTRSRQFPPIDSIAHRVWKNAEKEVRNETGKGYRVSFLAADGM
jgi:hypothetical protein